MKESIVHASLEKNLWVFGAEYSLFSSNQTLRRQVEEYIGKTYVGDRAGKRPDLMLSVNYAGKHLLVELKRPSHILKYVDYQQATHYRNDFKPYIASDIEILVVGGIRGDDLPDTRNIEPNTVIMIFDELISRSRSQLNWLLRELGSEARA